MENQPGSYNENQKSLQKFVLPFALGAAAVRIAIDISVKVANAGAVLYYATFFIAFILEIIFITYLLKKFKAKNGGWLSLPEALKIGVTTMLVTGFCYAAASYLHDTYIDPDFQARTLLELVDKYNPAQREQTMHQIELGKQGNNILGVFTSTLWFTIVGLVISLVSGSILRNK